MKSDRSILLLGGSSYVGRHIRRWLGDRSVIATYHSTPIPDGVKFDALTMNLREIVTDPLKISHAVVLLGNTKPDACHSDPQRSHALNIAAMQRMLMQLREWRICPVFTSTEAVFDGQKGDYVETDRAAPILVYGRQKLEIEKFIQSQFQHYLVVRLALVCGWQMGDGTLLTQWAEKIRDRQPIACATDFRCSPIHADDAAASISALIERDCHGLFHIAGPEGLTRCELLDLLLTEAGSRGRELPPVSRRSIRDFPTREPRPLDISMRPDKCILATGVLPRRMIAVCREIAEKAFEPRP